MQLGILHTLNAMLIHPKTANFIKFTCVWTLLDQTSLTALCSQKAKHVDLRLSSHLFKLHFVRQKSSIHVVLFMYSIIIVIIEI